MIFLKHFFCFLNENICCDSQLELSQRDSSNEGSKHVLKEQYRKLSLNYPFYPFLSGALNYYDSIQKETVSVLQIRVTDICCNPSLGSRQIQ